MIDQERDLIFEVQHQSDPEAGLASHGDVFLSDDMTIYVARFATGELVGSLFLRQRLGDGVWEIYNVRVAAPYRRQGVATALLARARFDLGRVDHAPVECRSHDGYAWSTAVP